MIGLLVSTIIARLGLLMEEALSFFPGAYLASQVVDILNPLLKNAVSAASATAVGRMVQAVVPQIEELHEIAAKRKFTRLEPWLADLIETVNALAQQIISPESDSFPASGGLGVTNSSR